MAKWKDVYGEEICSCGKKGTRIISTNGKITGYACEKHYEELQTKKA